MSSPLSSASSKSATHKRTRSPYDSDSSITRSRAKRRLLDSFTKLSIDSRANSRSQSYSPSPPGKKRAEPILRYDYWDRSKSAPTYRELDDDMQSRMDTGDAHTVFVSSLNSTSDDEDYDEDNNDSKIMFAPDVERKIMDLPYSLLRRRDEALSPAISQPIPYILPESSLVVYKPKEQIIAESIARQVEDSKSRVSKRRAVDNYAEEENWGDDELDMDDSPYNSESNDTPADDESMDVDI
ncbi:uncharacterized protein V1518DRAFT_436543 [Limtongia smithiae]|uniref:uncharacterized protein n=1 Tax=Limtongia smithiae TaxID=1125753 RepID=UPI0034CEC936